jgi:hypothetical protein
LSKQFIIDERRGGWRKFVWVRNQGTDGFWLKLGLLTKVHFSVGVVQQKD